MALDLSGFVQNPVGFIGIEFLPALMNLDITAIAIFTVAIIIIFFLLMLLFNFFA